MTKEEYLSKLSELGTCEDDAQRRVMITEIVDAANAVYNEMDMLKTSNTKFEADNKKLQEYNMQLFLRVGNQKQEQSPIEKTEQKVRTYANLFNEKGELK